MFRTALALSLLLAPALFFLGDWPVPDPLNIPSIPEIREQVPITVEVMHGEAEFEIDFQAHSQYLLIVSALGSSNEPWNVDLASRSGHEISNKALASLAPLPVLQQWPSHSQFDESGFVSLTAPVPAQEIRHFHLHVTDGPLDNPVHYARVKGLLIAEGDSVRIYLDDQMSRQQLKKGLVPELIRLFDEEILPKSRVHMGDFLDVDGDGKFAILLSPWLEKLQGGKTSLGGFVRGSDFQTDLKPPFSNRCDVLYLNSKLAPGPELRTLLAHEFAHAVGVSVRLNQSSQITQIDSEEDWLNEAIAHLAENLHSRDFSNLDYRISRFLSAPQDFRLVVPDYYRAGLWRNHGCRGATYLFLRWCVDVYGEELLSRLIHSPLSGRKNLERATGCSFEELYRNWSIALWQSVTTVPDKSEKDQTGKQLRWVALHEPVSQYQLCGPRALHWNLFRPHYSLKLQPTSSAYVVLESKGVSASQSRQRIQIRSEAGAKLQVTLIPLDNYRELALQTEFVQSESSSVEFPQLAPGEDAYPDLPLSLQIELPGKTQVQAIALEYHDGDTHKSMRFDREELEHYRLSQSLEGESRNEVYRLPGFPLATHEQTWLVKVQSESSEGTRIVGWSEVTIPPQTSFRLERTASHELPTYR